MANRCYFSPAPGRVQSDLSGRVHVCLHCYAAGRPLSPAGRPSGSQRQVQNSLITCTAGNVVLAVWGVVGGEGVREAGGEGRGGGTPTYRLYMCVCRCEG